MTEEYHELGLPESILITGGTGSLGSALVAEFLSRGVRRVGVFSRDEYKQARLTQRFSDAEGRLELIVGDIRDQSSVERAIKGFEAVVHAAALKRVSTAERFVSEAVRTNVRGTENLVAAVTRGPSTVQRVVGVSSDKAVEPTTAYGMTKALAERLIAGEGRDSGPVRLCVRYGNVIGSRGSVVESLILQAKAGRRATLVRPGITRFWLSIADAVETIIRGLTCGATGGEVVVRTSNSARLEDIGACVAAICGVEEPLVISSEMKAMGMGEKMHECLLSEDEAEIARVDGVFRTFNLEEVRCGTGDGRKSRISSSLWVKYTHEELVEAISPVVKGLELGMLGE
jgi:UDP-glucose 4-epimerase